MFLKEFFEKVNFEKKSADDNKSIKDYPACNILVIFRMRMEEEGQEWLYELLTEVQLEQFFTKLRDDLQVFRYGRQRSRVNDEIVPVWTGWKSEVYNHATTNLAIYSHETSKDKLSEA